MVRVLPVVCVCVWPGLAFFAKKSLEGLCVGCRLFCVGCRPGVFARPSGPASAWQPECGSTYARPRESTRTQSRPRSARHATHTRPAHKYLPPTTNQRSDTLPTVTHYQPQQTVGIRQRAKVQSSNHFNIYPETLLNFIRLNL